jgi:hypothetical protein
MLSVIVDSLTEIMLREAELSDDLKTEGLVKSSHSVLWNSLVLILRGELAFDGSLSLSSS